MFKQVTGIEIRLKLNVLVDRHATKHIISMDEGSITKKCLSVTEAEPNLPDAYKKRL